MACHFKFTPNHAHKDNHTEVVKLVNSFTDPLLNDAFNV